MSDSESESREAHRSEPFAVARPVAVDHLGGRIGARWAIRRGDPRLVTAGLALVALVAGGWWIRLSSIEPSAAARTSPPTSSPPATAGSSPDRVHSTTTTATAAVFVVDVVGAVHHPGVVSLPGTARVIDAVTAAGGARPDADLDRVNLAAHLVDGMRIAIPRRGAPADPAGPSSDPGAAPAAPGSGGSGAPSADAPLDLNTATEAQLEALPGIGPSLAQAILTEREHEGGFHTVDDLRRVRGIGDVRFAQLRPLVTV